MNHLTMVADLDVDCDSLEDEDESSGSGNKLLGNPMAAASSKPVSSSPWPVSAAAAAPLPHGAAEESVIMAAGNQRMIKATMMDRILKMHYGDSNTNLDDALRCNKQLKLLGSGLLQMEETLGITQPRLPTAPLKSASNALKEEDVTIRKEESDSSLELLLSKMAQVPVVNQLSAAPPLHQQQPQPPQQPQPSIPKEVFLEDNPMELFLSTMAHEEEEEPLASSSSTFQQQQQQTKPWTFPAHVLGRKPLPTSSQQRDQERKSALHKACQLFPCNPSIIEAALETDPEAIRRRTLIPAIVVSHHQTTSSNVPSVVRDWWESKESPAAKRRKRQQQPPPPPPTIALPEPFQLPINIALHHHANLSVLHLLVQADPSMIAQPDGIQGFNSLCLALQIRPKYDDFMDVIVMLLANNPDCVKTVVEQYDENTPLHIACLQYGKDTASKSSSSSLLQVITHLVQIFPEAMFHYNANALRPVDIVEQQQAPSCEEDAVVNFLQDRMKRTKI
jgi:hypothetical protein